MKKVVVYTGPNCPYCTWAKELLANQSIEFTEIDIASDESVLQEMLEKSKRRTVPQIFVGSHHVGGYDDLVNADKSGKLDQLINS